VRASPEKAYNYQIRNSLVFVLGWLGFLVANLRDYHGSSVLFYIGLVIWFVWCAYFCIDSLRLSKELQFERQNRKLKKEHAGAVCDACNQILVGLPTDGVCPECGTAYSLTQPTPDAPND